MINIEEEYYHPLVFVKPNGDPLSLCTELKLQLFSFLKGFDCNKIAAVTAGLTVSGLRITAFCFPTSLFSNL